jgi:hypothetical protein
MTFKKKEPVEGTQESNSAGEVKVTSAFLADIESRMKRQDEEISALKSLAGATSKSVKREVKAPTYLIPFIDGNPVVRVGQCKSPEGDEMKGEKIVLPVWTRTPEGVEKMVTVPYKRFMALDDSKEPYPRFICKLAEDGLHEEEITVPQGRIPQYVVPVAWDQAAGAQPGQKATAPKNSTGGAFRPPVDEDGRMLLEETKMIVTADVVFIEGPYKDVRFDGIAVDALNSGMG